MALAIEGSHSPEKPSLGVVEHGKAEWFMRAAYRFSKSLLIVFLSKLPIHPLAPEPPEILLS